ncbi:unnamed protein product [Microthlaspi erraticum]|uniref:Uncharacterized protein n=1 Tax=Microthlaspi erraticum TaxID=1685480 RepID=A0A6D2I0B4_9BRAS|nr:unnamed protein product [Microthlaspi erraticum]CAA7046105.1 unnamed protein product [Microthlaspi erraticum]
MVPDRIVMSKGGDEVMGGKRRRSFLSTGKALLMWRKRFHGGIDRHTMRDLVASIHAVGTEDFVCDEVLDKLDAALDVGGVYDPKRERYDHHRKGFTEHYGLEINAKELIDQTHPDVNRLFLAVYQNFIEAVDAIDNGIHQYGTEKPPRYVNNTSLAHRIGRLNLDWIETDQSTNTVEKS